MNYLKLTLLFTFALSFQPSYCQDSSDVSQMGLLEFENWGQVNDVALSEDGAYAYLTSDGNSPLTILDIQDHNNIHVAGKFDTDNERYRARRMILHENLIFADVTFPDRINYLAIFNVAEPSRPRLISSIPCGANMRMKVNGDLLYVGYRPFFNIYDISDLENPTLAADTLDLEGHIRDIEISDDHVFVSLDSHMTNYRKSGLAIVNVSDLENLEINDWIREGTRIRQTKINEDILVVGGINPQVESLSLYHIYNISNLDDPEFCSTLNYEGLSYSYEFNYIVNNTGLFIPGMYEDGDFFRRFCIRHIDITDPENPQTSVIYQDPLYIGRMQQIDIRNGLLIGCGSWEGHEVCLIDLNDMENVSLIKSYYTKYDAEQVLLGSGTAYLKCGPILRAVDVRNHETPRELSLFRRSILAISQVGFDTLLIVTQAHDFSILAQNDGLFTDVCERVELDFGLHTPRYNIFAMDNLIYADMRGMINIIDITDIENPIVVNIIEINPGINDFCRIEDTGFFAHFRGVLMVDLSNPVEPEIIREMDISRQANQIASSGSHIYAAGSSWVVAWDVSDLDNPIKQGGFNVSAHGGICTDLSVSADGDYLFVSRGTGGFTVLYIGNNPGYPLDVGYYDTPGSANDLAFDENGLVFVADSSNIGIYDVSRALDISNITQTPPYNFFITPLYPNPTNSAVNMNISVTRPGAYSIKLFDLTGRALKNTQMTYPSGGTYPVSMHLDGMAAGTYWVGVGDGGVDMRRKVVLVR